MIKAWRAVVTFCVYWWLKLGAYRIKSNIYRTLFERKYAKIEILPFTHLSQLPEFVKRGSLWRSDSWKQLFDAVSSPQYAQQVFSGKEPVPEHGLDCDEHAIFLVAAIKKSLELGRLTDKVKQPFFLTVTWFEDGWKPNGHNVCLFEMEDGKFYFMDYSEPNGGWDTIQDLVNAIRARYCSAKTVDSLCWCVSDYDLRPQITKWA